MTDSQTLRKMADTMPDPKWGETILHTRSIHDAAFIAAANPAEVLKLLDRIERLEGALKWYADVSNWTKRDHPLGGWQQGIAKDDKGDKAREALADQGQRARDEGDK